MPNRIENTGFSPPARRPLGNERRGAALAQLVATIALALATIVVATVVSAGIARADTIDGVVGNEGNLFAISMLLGLVFIGIGTILPNGESKKR
jgi:hypothetical protein